MLETITSKKLRYSLDNQYKSPNILMADDNPVNCQIVEMMFAKLGHKITLVHDGRAALEAVCAGNFDVVLMDVNMPRMNGVEAAAAIRERLGETAPPIVALTASIFPHEKERILQSSGIDGFLAKPVLMEELQNVLAKFCTA